MKYTYKIEQDDCEFNNPREWDNLGTMAFFHKRYNLGDDTGLSIEDAKEIENSKDYISLPVFMLDHGGIDISSKTTYSEYYMGMDSGQLGVIFVSKDAVREAFNVKRITKNLEKKVINILHGEVETYNQFVTGDVYCYEILDESGDIVDSCGGIFGYNNCKEEIESLIEALSRPPIKQEFTSIVSTI